MQRGNHCYDCCIYVSGFSIYDLRQHADSKDQVMVFGSGPYSQLSKAFSRDTVSTHTLNSRSENCQLRFRV